MTDRANVSRTTFYLHYQNIGDLFQSIEDEVVAQYEDIINRIVSDEFDILYVRTDKKGQKWLPHSLKHSNFSMTIRNSAPSFYGILKVVFSERSRRGHDAVLERSLEELRPI